jgi:uncharacterized protein
MMDTTVDTERFTRQKTVLLTTYKRDGSPVGTPVSIVVHDDRAYFRTYDRAWKAKRLRNNPEVEVAPSTTKGKPTGPAVHGRARLLTDAEARPVRRLLTRKYPFLHGIAVPLLHKLKRYRTLHYELTLDQR